MDLTEEDKIAYFEFDSATQALAECQEATKQADVRYQKALGKLHEIAIKRAKKA